MTVAMINTNLRRTLGEGDYVSYFSEGGKPNLLRD
jgi:hypothetical protein